MPLNLDVNIIAIILISIFLLFVIVAFKHSKNNSTVIKNEMSGQIAQLSDHLQALNNNQNALAGSLRTIAETQAATQAQITKTLESRLEQIQKNMGESLHGSAKRTAHSLGELQQRLATIDKAQTNIEKLSGDVLSLQDILSNKQTRGAYGEIQLSEIVSRALPPDAYRMQATLSNGKRADCLIDLPNPPGAIAIDSKFPLESYELLRAAKNTHETDKAKQMMRISLRKHIKSISEKYIIEGETADGALMFLPSEAVYAELHANFADIVREGFDARVWIVSPTTCMATLNTMRAILKDARMREQAGAIRNELSALCKDVDRLQSRVIDLDKHFGLAAKDIEKIKISATKAGTRAIRLDNFEFDDVTAKETSKILHIP